MAVKRNNNLSSTISRLDRRVHTVESRAVSLAGASGVTTTAPSDEDPAGAPGALGATPPYRYRPVTKAYIYGDKVTGNNSRLELYFSEDPEIVAQDTLRLQGLHGTSTDNFELSPKTFKVFATDTPPWTDDVRARQPWRNTPTVGNNGETVEYTVWFNPVVEVPTTYPSNAGRELITTRKIDTMSVTGSTVTVNLNATHLFEVGDVIYIDSISTHTVLFGVDGLFKVSEVVSSTVIKYELDAPVSIPFSLSSAQVGTKYVYPVAQRFVEEGTIWTDTSVEPNRVYVWKDYRWYDTADPIGTVTAQQDGIAPSPVTDLEGDTEVPAGSDSPVIDLTWVPPTTRSNGSPISGFLSGYEIRYKRSTEPTWNTEFIPDGGEGLSSYRISTGLQQNFNYNIEVYVVDIMSQRSTAATLDILTAKYSEVLNPPAAPTVRSKLGTITVDWSGLDSTGNLPVQGVLFVEIHESTTSGFTPSDATLVESIPISSGGNYAVLTGRLFDNTTFYYYKVIFVRRISATELVKSDPSAESPGIKVQGVVGPDIVAGSITTNNLEAGFVTAEIVRGNSIIAQEPLSTRRIEIKASGITAYPVASPTNYSFELQSNTGNVTIVGGTLKTTTGLRGVEMSPTGLVARNSSGDPTFTINAATGNVEINGGSLTITSGLAGYIPTGGAADDINNSPPTTTISGGKITTGSIEADVISADAISAYIFQGREIRLSAQSDNSNPKISLNKDRIAAFRLNGTTSFRLTKDGQFFADDIFIDSGTLSGTLSVSGTITGGTLVGGTIRTLPAGDDSGKRIVINTQGEVVFFNAGSSTAAGRVEATATGIAINGTTGGILSVGITPIVSWDSTSVSIQQNTQVTGRVRASGQVQSNNGACIMGANITTTGDVSANGSLSGATLSTTGVSSLGTGGAALNVGRVPTSGGGGGIFMRNLEGGGTTAAGINNSGALIRGTSSRRYKQDIQNLVVDYNDVINMQPKTYRRIEEVEQHGEDAVVYGGFIAEDLAGTSLEPFVVYAKDENGNRIPDGIHYAELTAALVSVIKEQDNRLIALEARLAALEGN